MILVTGASGFVGQHLVRMLSAKQQPVKAIYNSTPPPAEVASLPNVTWQQCDLLDIFEVEDAMKGVDDIYHCAGIVSFNPKDKQKVLHFNVESTTNIVNQALEQGIRKMIYVSSVAALGRSEEQKEITEEEQWEESKYNSAYGSSKYLAESEVWRGVAEGLNAVIVNPSTILGEGNWDKGSARLIKVVYDEFPFYTEGITGWVDVQDVVKALYMLMQSDITNERFIVSEGNHEFREVFTLMANAMGRKPPHIKASGWMTGLVWRWNVLRNALFGKQITVTKETAAIAMKQSFYNNTKLLEALPGFSYTPFKQTVERMAKAYLAHKH
ncbi:MAG: NAD-dependent epimerase/dehydratase family protein [Sphingobacteriales bacterium]|nr:MAG: NAD-dependent epimerase/dehydratase family protein [Sphingobacteriales bacterium]